jgi:non-heme chloroperoxidase
MVAALTFADSATLPSLSSQPKGEIMSTITTKDGTKIYYKDWGKGPVVTFSHGWPLNSDAWDGQMLFLVQHGYRCLAVDRRGHGRSSQASSGNDMNGYADDLAAVIEALDLKNAVLIGHSTGGGEVARYVGRHGSKRVAAAVLVAAVPPSCLNPPPTRKAYRWKFSTQSAPGLPVIGRSTTKTLRCSSMGQQAGC